MADAIKWVERDQSGKNIFWPSQAMKDRAWVSDSNVYEESAKDPVTFWAQKAKEGLTWFKDFDNAYEENLPYFKWFQGGKINACYNALDRHVEAGKGNKPALIWEPEPVEEKTIVLTYSDMLREVKKFANVLKSLGVGKGDRVSIYMPMIPEVQIAMLACARIGAIHSVVFSAFSANSLNARIIDAEAKVLVTADGYWRRGKQINLKEAADKGAFETGLSKMIVVKRLGLNVQMHVDRDAYWHDLMQNASEDCPVEEMDSEDTLFILYTSGTTGKPKGVIHETGGYMTQAHWTTKLDFDLHDDDIFWCTADVGWITGHTYACYGPLSNHATMVVFEGSPDFPDAGRLWQIAEKNKVTVFYTAPTAIRMFERFGNEWPQKYDLSSFRILGTVGEPIDEQAWMWYFEIIGQGRCPIIDTWWQTETGGTLINVLPGIGPFVPTVAGRNFPGAVPEILTEKGEPVEEDEGGFLVLKSPFPPGLLRGVWKNPEKYKNTYWSDYEGKYYNTSDGAIYVNGLIRVTGRVDDVMKVAGHRLSTAEIENALDLHDGVSECAVVPMPHEIKGDVPLAFVILKPGFESSEQLLKELVEKVREEIGPTAKPEKILFVKDLPKTRSGKIMRRFLKALVRNEKLGDITTLSNPESIGVLKEIVGYKEPQ